MSVRTLFSSVLLASAVVSSIATSSLDTGEALGWSETATHQDGIASGMVESDSITLRLSVDSSLVTTDSSFDIAIDFVTDDLAGPAHGQIVVWEPGVQTAAQAEHLVFTGDAHVTWHLDGALASCTPQAVGMCDLELTFDLSADAPFRYDYTAWLTADLSGTAPSGSTPVLRLDPVY
ncbi:MAG: hypothetical protein R3F61_01715 [Myxococcota bacterium]